MHKKYKLTLNSQHC